MFSSFLEANILSCLGRIFVPDQLLDRLYSGLRNMGQVIFRIKKYGTKGIHSFEKMNFNKIDEFGYGGVCSL